MLARKLVSPIAQQAEQVSLEDTGCEKTVGVVGRHWSLEDRRCHEKTLRHKRDAVPEASAMRRPWAKHPCREQTLPLISGREKTVGVMKDTAPREGRYVRSTGHEETVGKRADTASDQWS